jgi:hypothetical protein
VQALLGSNNGVGVGTMAGKRELTDTGADKRYARRDEKGRFKESDDVGRSLSQDQKRQGKGDAGKGQGDKGDRQNRSAGT